MFKMLLTFWIVWFALNISSAWLHIYWLITEGNFLSFFFELSLGLNKDRLIGPLNDDKLIVSAEVGYFLSEKNSFLASY